jgi:hypothetical protein
MKSFSRIYLIAISIFVSVGALYGGVAAFISPNFMGAEQLVPIFQDLPAIGSCINSLTLPASTLLLFIFLPQAIAAVLLLRKRSSWFVAVVICGVILAIFTIVELIVIPNVVSVIYLAFGLSELAIAWLLFSKRKRVDFQKP